jgi:hypothetical protein
MSSCTADAWDALSHVSPWLRAETIEGARRCLSEPYCRNSVDCLNAWKSGVFSNPSAFIFFD